MTESPEVSVIIPTFNRPAFLEESVQSVLAQSYPAREIIIIDDGSDVRFRDRINAVTRLGAQISLHTLPSHRGASAARNIGLEKAQGDYVLFLDDDDLIHPHMLESNLAVFEQYPGTDVVTCLSEIFLDHGHLDGPLHPERTRDFLRVVYPSNPPDYLRLEQITFSNIMLFAVTVHSCLVRRKAIGDIRFPEDLTAGEDTYFWLSLAFQGCIFKMNKKSYTYVRLHGWNSRLKEGHEHSVVTYLYKLLSSGMLQSRYDYLIVHAKIFRTLFQLRRLSALKHLLFTLRFSDMIPKYLYLHFKKESRRIRTLHKRIESLAVSFPSPCHTYEQAQSAIYNSRRS